MLVVAIDIGGTFTDLAAFDREAGRLVMTKSLTTYDDLVNGLMDCFRKARIDLPQAEIRLRAAIAAAGSDDLVRLVPPRRPWTLRHARRPYVHPRIRNQHARFTPV